MHITGKDNKVKEWRLVCQESQSQRQANVAVLITALADFKQKLILTNKETIEKI